LSESNCHIAKAFSACAFAAQQALEHVDCHIDRDHFDWFPADASHHRGVERKARIRDGDRRSSP
jgi:hypothetical protein